MWNALSPDIKLSRNANAFKKMLKSSLLESIDIYVEFVLQYLRYCVLISLFALFILCCVYYCIDV